MKRKLIYGLEEMTHKPLDILHLGVPLFIRLLEFSREDARSDEDLHRMTERLTEACSNNVVVGMEVYDEVTQTIKADQEMLYTLKNDRPDDIEAYADKKNRKYLIDTRDHTKAAWSYINMPKNAAKYTADELKAIKENIKKAAKKFDIEIHDHEAAQETILEESVVKVERSDQVDEYVSELTILNASIEHLTKVRTIIMKHDVSDVLMKTIDPNNVLVDAGICCSYEDLLDVPKMYFDTTIDGINAAIESANDKKKGIFAKMREKAHAFLIKHKIIREKYEKYLHEAIVEFDKIKEFDEAKFEATNIVGASKAYTDKMLSIAEKTIPFFDNDFLVKSVDEMIGFIKKEDPDMSKKISDVLKKIGSHFKPLVNNSDFEEFARHKIILNNNGEMVDYQHIKDSKHDYGKTNSIDKFGWKLSDIKSHAARIDKCIEDDAHMHMSFFDETMFGDLYDANYYDDNPKFASEIKRVETIAQFVYCFYYDWWTFDLITKFEKMMHQMFIAAIKAKKE